MANFSINYDLKYDNFARWVSYWHQIREVLEKKPKSVLEIGCGNKTVADFLKKRGIKITTLDINPCLKPDVVGDVRNLPFQDDEFDLILCAQVLEHLPFADFPQALREIKRVVKKYVVLSLPEASITNLYFGFKIFPFIPKIEKVIKINFPLSHKIGEHKWEIGKRGYALKRIVSIFKSQGFSIVKTFCPIQNPYHRFFVLKKK
jgi:ubiquinone/menaquinone biosynthesis C-methylase UbiE